MFRGEFAGKKSHPECIPLPNWTSSLQFFTAVNMGSF